MSHVYIIFLDMRRRQDGILSVNVNRTGNTFHMALVILYFTLAVIWYITSDTNIQLDMVNHVASGGNPLGGIYGYLQTNNMTTCQRM